MVIEDHFEHVDCFFDIVVVDLEVLDCFEKHAYEIFEIMVFSNLVLNASVKIVILHGTELHHEMDDFCQLGSDEIILELVKEVLDTLLPFLLPLLFIFVHCLSYPNYFDLSTFGSLDGQLKGL